eukprot:6034756-Amphidinium_carterae.1
MHKRGEKGLNRNRRKEIFQLFKSFVWSNWYFGNFAPSIPQVGFEGNGCQDNLTDLRLKHERGFSLLLVVAAARIPPDTNDAQNQG